MGAVWVGDTLAVTIETVSRKALLDAIWAVNDIANAALSAAANEMVKTIETTPSSIRKHKPNRIDTGLMKNSVDVVDIHKSGNKKYEYEGYAGWIYVVEDYFLVQDKGGRSSGLVAGDRTITPMHAISKAFYMMKEELSNGIKSS